MITAQEQLNAIGEEIANQIEVLKDQLEIVRQAYEAENDQRARYGQGVCGL